MPLRNTWLELREEHDVRRQDVGLAIGCLFEDYYPDVWAWKLYEVANKLAITGALSFIAPGSTTQIVAGMGIAFFSLLVFLRFLPYPKKTIRQLACACATGRAQPLPVLTSLSPPDTCNVVVFLFFVLALLLRFDIKRILINGDPVITDLFYSVFVLGLWISIVLTLAVVSYTSGDLDTILITGHEEEDD